LASAKKTFPACVSSTRRRSRENSLSPSSSSSVRICWLSGGCDKCSRAAARPKWSSSATATKYRRCLNSIAKHRGALYLNNRFSNEHADHKTPEKQLHRGGLRTPRRKMYKPLRKIYLLTARSGQENSNISSVSRGTKSFGGGSPIQVPQARMFAALCSVRLETIRIEMETRSNHIPRNPSAAMIHRTHGSLIALRIICEIFYLYVIETCEVSRLWELPYKGF